MVLPFTGTGGSVECSTSTTAKRRDVIARVFGQNGGERLDWSAIGKLAAMDAGLSPV
jgi:hypothetical protein